MENDNSIEIDSQKAPSEVVGDGLNRKTRRSLKQEKRKMKKSMVDKSSRIIPLKNTEQIFDEDVEEIDLLVRDLEGYSEAQATSKMQHLLARIYANAGAKEETIKKYFIPGHDKIAAFTQIMAEANPGKMLQSRNILGNIVEILNRKKVLFEDEDEKEIVKDMDSQGLPLDDMFKELIRSRQESIDLMQMQIDHLREQEVKKKKAIEDEKKLDQMVLDEERRKQEVEHQIKDATVKDQKVEAIEEPMIEDKFPLSDWNISWTSRFWSDNPNHLEKIDTTDRDIALSEIESKAGQEISVGSKSVLRALEFHLFDKDKIQKALSSRNKYSPEAIRRWVKVKRGKDRIGILIDDEKPNTAIFFVGGRDTVYRGL